MAHIREHTLYRVFIITMRYVQLNTLDLVTDCKQI